VRDGVFTTILATLALGCGLFSPLSERPLEVANGTTLPITLVVNGEPAMVVPPKSSASIPGADLPPMPWHVSVRTPTGRELGTIGIGADDVARTTGPDAERSQQGAGLRLDLSCGRLDIWVGPPMIGPVPGPGAPGDCEP
jgi:hypothetical protein